MQQEYQESVGQTGQRQILELAARGLICRVHAQESAFRICSSNTLGEGRQREWACLTAATTCKVPGFVSLFLDIYKANLLIHLFVYLLEKCFIFLYLHSGEHIFTKETLDKDAWKCVLREEILPSR